MGTTQLLLETVNLLGQQFKNLKPKKEYRWKLWSEGRWP